MVPDLPTCFKAQNRSTSKHLWIDCGAFRVTPTPYRAKLCSRIRAQWTQRAAFAERPTRLVAALPAGPTKVHSLRTKSATSVPITALNAAPWCAPWEPSFPNEDSASLARWAPTKMCQSRLPSARHVLWDARRPGVELRSAMSASVTKTNAVGRVFTSARRRVHRAPLGATLIEIRLQRPASSVPPASTQQVQDKHPARLATGAN